MARLRGREAHLDIPVSVSEIPIMSDIPANDVSFNASEAKQEWFEALSKANTSTAVQPGKAV